MSRKLWSQNDGGSWQYYKTVEEIKRILNRHNIRVHFRASDTIRSGLVKVKDNFPKKEQQNAVYETSFHDYMAAYVIETSRQLNLRLKEYK